MRRGIERTWWVRSRPSATTGQPAANTSCAACGSAWMLYSAEAVMLPPSLRAPPITTISRRRPARCGAMVSAVATLVMGPVTASVIAPTGASRSVRTRNSTACSAAAAAAGSCTVSAPSPDSPWKCPASTGARDIGRGQPANTGTSSRPAISRTSRALRAVSGAATLPPTVVMPSRSSASRAANARNSATASSTPGSQSMISLRLSMSSALPGNAAMYTKPARNWRAQARALTAGRRGRSVSQLSRGGSRWLSRRSRSAPS